MKLSHSSASHAECLYIAPAPTCTIRWLLPLVHACMIKVVPLTAGFLDCVRYLLAL